MVDKVVVIYNIAVSPSYTVCCIWSNRTQCHHQLAISTIFLLASKLCCLGTTTIRGGVEDTRLEAKAKDTKKSPRPRTAFPRTDTLEAKDRNARGQGQGLDLRGQGQGLQNLSSRPRDVLEDSTSDHYNKIWMWYITISNIPVTCKVKNMQI